MTLSDSPSSAPPTKFHSLTQALSHWSRVQPDAPLLLAPETGAVCTYRQLAALTGKMAAYFDAQGVEPGAHVALYMPNGLGCLAVFLATLCSGRVIAPLNLLAHRSQLQYVVRHCDARLLFASADLAPKAREAATGLERPFEIVELDPDRLDGPWDRFAEQALTGRTATDDPALLMYTSGTTGTPKGACLSQANLLASAHAVAAWHDLGPADRVQSALPIYHINGQVIATLTPFLSGGSIVAPRKFSTSSWWETARQYQPTWLNMVPTIIAYLLNDAATDTTAGAAQAGRSACPGLRFARSASAPLPPEHHRAFETRFKVPVIEAMGMTETASVVFCNPMQGERKIGTPGQRVGIEAKVVDAQGNTLPDGTAGEIWLRGPSVMRQYYNAPEQTRDAFAGEWLRTGDLGMCDADGFFYITGRLKELIIKGGENIAPREIDEALLRHPAVLEAAAVAIPDANFGQEILAAIIVRDGVKVDEALEQSLREFCLEELGKYKSPKVYKFMSELPKGPSGKVQRLKIVESLS